MKHPVPKALLAACGIACLLNVHAGEVPVPPNLLTGVASAKYKALASSIMRQAHSEYNAKGDCWTVSGNNKACWRPVSLHAPISNPPKRTTFYYLLALEMEEGKSAKMYAVEQMTSGSIYFHGMKTVKGHGGFITDQEDGFGKSAFIRVGKDLYGWKIHEEPQEVNEPGFDTYYVFPKMHRHNIFSSQIIEMGKVFTRNTEVLSTRNEGPQTYTKVNDYLGRSELDASRPDAEVYPLKITYRAILGGTQSCIGCEATGGKKRPPQEVIVPANPKTLKYSIPKRCPMNAGRY